MTKWGIAGIVVAIVLGGGLMLVMGRERYERHFDLALSDGRRALVTLRGSQRRSFGGHPIVLGGGDHRVDVQIDIGAQRFRWSGADVQPMLVDSVDGRLYLVVFHKELELTEEQRFQIFVREGNDWGPAPRSLLPRTSATQNIGFGEWEGASPETSLTGKLRYWLNADGAR